MNLIDQVGRLKELEAKISQEGHGAPDPIWCEYSDALCDAAPAMLGVLGGFQVGDAHALTEITALLEEVANISPGDRDLLHRMQAMAAKMGAEQ
jgi:hypothetical protein